MKRTLLTLLLSAAGAFAADMPVINDRLILDMPEGAQYGMRTTALMAADPGDDESLIWVGDGDDRIAVYVQELDRLADPDFDKQAREIFQNFNEGDLRFEVRKRSDDIYYAVRTSTPKEPTGADLFGSALIRHKDGSLIRVSILFARNQVKSPQKCREWVEKAIDGIRFGKGVRPSAARTDKFEGLEIPVPEGYVRTIEPGADFVCITYRQRKRVNEPASGFGIYLGHDPDVSPDPEARKVEETMVGQKVTWYCTEPRPGFFAAECLTKLDEVYMHVFLFAPTAEARDALIRQLSQIKRAQASE